MNPKTADRILNVLSGTGDQGRARKAIQQFRRSPSKAGAAKADAMIARLDENVQIEIRQAALC